MQSSSLDTKDGLMCPHIEWLLSQRSSTAILAAFTKKKCDKCSGVAESQTCRIKHLPKGFFFYNRQFGQLRLQLGLKKRHSMSPFSLQANTVLQVSKPMKTTSSCTG